MSSNQPLPPYQPPPYYINPNISRLDPTRDLASRWQRLGGALLDGLIQSVASIPLLFGMSLQALAQSGSHAPDPLSLYLRSGGWGIVAAAGALVIAAVQSVLLVQRGQTLGKMAAGTRIVKLDGSPAPFLSVPVLRYWLLFAIGFVPVIGGMFSLVDALFVFSTDRRCLHDHIAGTKVVRADALPPGTLPFR